MIVKTSLIHRDAVLMGSPFSIRAYVPDRGQELRAAEGAIALAFAEIRRIEDLLTDFRASPFNRINEMAGKAPVRVCEEIYDIVELTLAISRDSDGAFDISYAAVGLLWREAMRRGEPPTEEALAQVKRFVNFRKIHMDPFRREIFLPESEMRIGLGGIGKGYAVDRAFDLLNRFGLENFSVNGAGDIRVRSAPNAPRPWRIGIRNPLAERDEGMGYLTLHNGAVATSGDYERFFRYQGKKYHHVLDGRTGEITENVTSVTVTAKNAATADICATTAMALGPVDGLAFLNRRRHMTGMIVTSAGQVFKTDPVREIKKECVLANI